MRIKLNVFFILFLFASYFVGWLEHSLVLFASVLLHELGHVFTAYRLRISVYEVELLPYGGMAKMEELSKFGGAAEAVVAAAGPVTSLVIAIVCLCFRGLHETFDMGFRYNLIICVFNLLPMVPLDGGRIARNLLGLFMGYRKATRVLVLIGRAAAFIMLGSNIYMLSLGGRSAALAIAASFIYLGTVKEEKASAYYYLFTGNNTKNMLINQGRIKKRFIKASEETKIRWAVNQFSPVTQCFIEVIDISGDTKRILSEEEIMSGFLKFGYEGIIRQIIDGR